MCAVGWSSWEQTGYACLDIAHSRRCYCTPAFEGQSCLITCSLATTRPNHLLLHRAFLVSSRRSQRGTSSAKGMHNLGPQHIVITQPRTTVP